MVVAVEPAGVTVLSVSVGIVVVVVVISVVVVVILGATTVVVVALLELVTPGLVDDSDDPSVVPVVWASEDPVSVEPTVELNDSVVLPVDSVPNVVVSGADAVVPVVVVPFRPSVTDGSVTAGVEIVSDDAVSVLVGTVEAVVSSSVTVDTVSVVGDSDSVTSPVVPVSALEFVVSVEAGSVTVVPDSVDTVVNSGLSVGLVSVTVDSVTDEFGAVVSVSVTVELDSVPSCVVPVSELVGVESAVSEVDSVSVMPSLVSEGFTVVLSVWVDVCVESVDIVDSVSVMPSLVSVSVDPVSVTVESGPVDAVSV